MGALCFWAAGTGSAPVKHICAEPLQGGTIDGLGAGREAQARRILGTILAAVGGMLVHDEGGDAVEALRCQVAEAERRLNALRTEQDATAAELNRLRDALARAAPPDAPAPAVAPAASTAPKTPAEKLRLFRALFRGRPDVYPLLWINDRTGRKGYAPACRNEWVRGVCEKPRVSCGECPNQAFLPVDDETVLGHLQGRHVMGVYPMLPDDTCWFVAADFDRAGWVEDIVAFRETAMAVGLPVGIERSRSGNGGHAWLFFDSPLPASLARTLATHVLTETLARRPQLGLASYDRLFPSQDTLLRGGFGNLIALPLQRGSRAEGNSVFLDDSLDPWGDQWAHLAALAAQRITADTAERIVAAATRAGRVVPVRRLASATEGDALPIPPRPTPRLPAPIPEQVSATLGSRLLIDKAGLPPALVDQMQRLAAFQNPEFYQRQRLRLSTFLTPRVISCAEYLDDQLSLPRGCLPDLQELLSELGIALQVADERQDGDAIQCGFQGELTAVQADAAACLLQHDMGVFVAPPGTGKTVVGAFLVARRARSTLVLVHRRPLLDQWIAQLSAFLGLEPRRIGRLGAGQRRLTRHIDVAMLQSLVRGDVVDPVVADYGHVVVDECHHVPAFSFDRVMSGVRARFVTGLTATPERRDGQHPILEMQLGPARFIVDSRALAARTPFVRRLIVKETTFVLPSGGGSETIQELYGLLAQDDARNDLIVNDVIGALAAGRCPLVLTERREHLELLASRLAGFTRHLVVLQGGRTARQARDVAERLAAIPDQEERLILATGRFVGEGFDDARLDTLFLTMPISWSGTLKQYAGRLQRLHTRKAEVRMVDYADIHVPMLQKMFAKRMKTYRSLGYTVAAEAPRRRNTDE